MKSELPNKINKNERQRLNRHKSCVLWFTGLSGAGKSALASGKRALSKKYSLLHS